MDSYYTKSKPKVVDYNPLTHMGFYNQPSSPAPYSRESPSQKIALSSYLDSPQKYPRSTSLAGKNIFSSSGNNTNRSPSLEALRNSDETPRFYKTRPKNKLVDPISGEIKIYNISRPKIENLDVSYNRDKITPDFDFNSIKMFNEKKTNLKSNDNIAGSLKKEVPFVPYVDPFILKSQITG